MTREYCKPCGHHCRCEVRPNRQPAESYTPADLIYDIGILAIILGVWTVIILGVLHE